MAWGEGKSESPADREKRLSAAAAKGMIHSEMTYDIAKNCFGCHTVPNEKLVNVGQHKAGSDFDLVSWAGGEVRHNYASSPGAPDSPTNREFSAEERRLLYVAMTRARESLSLMRPLKYWVPEQARHGDKHVYGAKSRFLTPAVMKHLKLRTHAGAQPANYRAAGDCKSNMDVRERARMMF